MLKECKRALPYDGTLADGELARLCMAGAMDLKTRGVVFPDGQAVSFTFTEEVYLDPETDEPEKDPATGENRTYEKVTDTSTLTDDLIMRAIITYVKANFGNPPNYQNLLQSYQTQLGQLMVTDGYTDYSMIQPVEPDPEPEPEPEPQPDPDPEPQPDPDPDPIISE